MVSKPQNAAKRPLLTRSLSVLSAPPTLLGLFFAALTAFLSCEARARQEPDIVLRVMQTDVRDDQDKQLVSALQDELSSLQSDHFEYSADYLVAAIESLQDPKFRWRAAPEEGNESLTLAGVLGTARTGIQNLLANLETQENQLTRELELLSPNNVDTALSELANLESSYYQYTGSVLLELMDDLRADSVLGVESRLERTSQLLQDRFVELSRGTEDLVGELEEIEGEYLAKKPPRRLHIRVIVENHSQQSTVVRRDVLARFRGNDDKPHPVDLEAPEDRTISGYSVAEMSFSSESIWDLGKEVQAILDPDGEGREDPECEIVVASDLFGEVWNGTCRDTQKRRLEDEMMEVLFSDDSTAGWVRWVPFVGLLFG